MTTRPEPKFAPGEPAILAVEADEIALNGIRIVVISVEWLEDDISGDGYAYMTIPHGSDPRPWHESCLRPLPPEELSGCFDSEEIPHTNNEKVKA